MPEPAATRAEVCRLVGELRPELTQLGVRSLALFGSAARDALDAASDVDVAAEVLGADAKLGGFGAAVGLDGKRGTGSLRGRQLILSAHRAAG